MQDRRPARANILIALGVVGLVALVGIGIDLAQPGPRPSPSLPSTTSTASPVTRGSSTPSGSPQPSASPKAPTPDIADTQEGIDVKPPSFLPPRIELYAGSVSVTPGQPITLHISTAATTYSYDIRQLDAIAPGGGPIVSRSGVRLGHDYRSLSTFDSKMRTARANWPATDTVNTAGWTPGVYVVTARDSRRTTGQAMFVVRTPELQHSRPAFVFSALTYEAYNLWGGADLYDYAAPRAFRVSFERPYELDGGKGYWTRSDDRILAWLQRRRIDLQYTTDYDLSVAPPAVAPKLLIFPRHSEYIPASLRDWLDLHVNALGDMNVLNFGSNSIYWQIRLAPARTPDAPMDIVCYKSAKDDPHAGIDPAHATVRWRSEPVNRPEGDLLGAQYVAVLGDGFTRFDFTVTAQMPADLLAGTGWRTGTPIRGLLLGEGDLVYPGSGGVAIMDGAAVTGAGKMTPTSVTIRVSPAGARVFDAGTFAWADGFAPARTNLGVPVSSFERFNRNVLAWLGCPATA